MFIRLLMLFLLFCDSTGVDRVPPAGAVVAKTRFPALRWLRSGPALSAAGCLAQRQSGREVPRSESGESASEEREVRLE